MDASVRKTLEFLVENRAFDYSKEEMAEGADISRPTLYRIWLIKLEIAAVKEQFKRMEQEK